jgi:hypothetical protein
MATDAPTTAEAVTQYMAPITGLAGIAVGYFFGRASNQAP